MTTPTTSPEPKPSSPPAPWRYRQAFWPAYKRILQRSSWPILVGPWLGEVGFEALYWLPWLSHFRESCCIAKDRIIPITRGGAAAWYGVPKGLELHAMRSVVDLRVEAMLRHQQTGMLKQMTVSPLEQAIIRETVTTLGLRRYHVLHPAWMYHELEPYWANQRGLAWLQARCRYETPTVSALPAEVAAKLPAEYVAVRFYARPTFPMTHELEQFCGAALQAVSKTAPIVVLNHTLPLDDHVDFKVPNGVPVIKMTDLLPVTPENNLAVQSALIAKSSGYLGTYGGLAQFALRCGKPTVTVFHEWHSTCVAHRFLSEALALQTNVPFHVLRVGDLPMVQAVLPRVVLQQAA